MTNMDTRHFSSKNEIVVDVKKLGFHMLDDLLEVGDQYVQELQAQQNARKAQETPDGRTGRKRKKLAGGHSLRERDPWTAEPRRSDGSALSVQNRE